MEEGGPTPPKVAPNLIPNDWRLMIISLVHSTHGSRLHTLTPCGFRSKPLRSFTLSTFYYTPQILTPLATSIAKRENQIMPWGIGGKFAYRILFLLLLWLLFFPSDFESVHSEQILRATHVHIRPNFSWKRTVASKGLFVYHRATIRLERSCQIQHSHLMFFWQLLISFIFL